MNWSDRSRMDVLMRMRKASVLTQTIVASLEANSLTPDACWLALQQLQDLADEAALAAEWDCA